MCCIVYVGKEEHLIMCTQYVLYETHVFIYNVNAFITRVFINTFVLNYNGTYDIVVVRSHSCIA